MKKLFVVIAVSMLFVIMYFYVDFSNVHDKLASGNDRIIDQINKMGATAAGKKDN